MVLEPSLHSSQHRGRVFGMNATAYRCLFRLGGGGGLGRFESKEGNPTWVWLGRDGAVEGLARADVEASECADVVIGSTGRTLTETDARTEAGLLAEGDALKPALREGRCLR